MNHKKHISPWFTTSSYRAINLALVTDIRIIKPGDCIIGGTVYLVGSDRSGTAAIELDANDTVKILDLLV